MDLGEILRTAIDRVSDRQPVPQASIDASKLPISADRDRLFAVFYHVLRNAQDACDNDGRIEVTLKVADGVVEVEIADNGAGMSEQFMREQLFKPFESTKGADGMGIGAYQAREYVRELSGDIRYESAPGNGTTVTISLPRVAR